jgi:hypothetical protein
VAPFDFEVKRRDPHAAAVGFGFSQKPPAQTEPAQAGGDDDLVEKGVPAAVLE